MTEKSKEFRKQDATPVESGAMPQGANLASALDPLNWLGSAWLKNWGAVSSEVTHFVAERIHEDVKTQHRILNCKNLDELQMIQTKFVQTAIDQYTAETGKLVKIGQEFADRLAQKKPN